MKTTGVCQHCRQKKKLCKAHILPEWCYRRLYPTGKIEGESLIAISPGLNYTQKMRKGSYDNTILCADCDNTFSEYENYAKKVMDSENWQIKYSTHGVQLLI